MLLYFCLILFLQSLVQLFVTASFVDAYLQFYTI